MQGTARARRRTCGRTALSALQPPPSRRPQRSLLPQRQASPHQQRLHATERPWLTWAWADPLQVCAGLWLIDAHVHAGMHAASLPRLSG